MIEDKHFHTFLYGKACLLDFYLVAFIAIWCGACSQALGRMSGVNGE